MEFSVMWDGIGDCIFRRFGFGRSLKIEQALQDSPTSSIVKLCLTLKSIKLCLCIFYREWRKLPFCKNSFRILLYTFLKRVLFISKSVSMRTMKFYRMIDFTHSCHKMTKDRISSRSCSPVQLAPPRHSSQNTCRPIR